MQPELEAFRDGHRFVLNGWLILKGSHSESASHATHPKQLFKKGLRLANLATASKIAV